MLLFGPYTVNTSSSTTITGLGGYPDTRAIIVMNESPYFLRITVNGVGIWGIPAQTADILDVGGSFSGSIQIECTDYLLTSINAPSYVVYVQTIGLQDSIYRSLQQGGVTGYPLTLPRLQSIGNAVNTNSVSNTLQNDGNPSGTNIIESTPATAPGSTIVINNDGTVTIKGFNTGTLTTLLQLLPSAGTNASSVILGDVSRVVEILGAMKVDGTATITGATTINNTITSNNKITCTQLGMTQGTLSRINSLSATVINGKNTINHGLGVVPDHIIVGFRTQSTPTSGAVIGYDNTTLTSTTVDIYSNIGGTAIILAIKF